MDKYIVTISRPGMDYEVSVNADEISLSGDYVDFKRAHKIVASFNKCSVVSVILADD